MRKLVELIGRLIGYFILAIPSFYFTEWIANLVMENGFQFPCIWINISIISLMFAVKDTYFKSKWDF